MHGEDAVRRNDKAITDVELMERLLRSAHVGRLAMISHGAPYVVPLQYVYQRRAIYFHSAHEGRKIDALTAAPSVCFEIDFYDGVLSGDSPCSFATRYASVIVFGTAALVQETAEKHRALVGIMHKYAGPGAWNVPPRQVDATTVVRITCDEVTGKLSGDYHP